jgi:hypothetical protein
MTLLVLLKRYSGWESRRSMVLRGMEKRAANGCQVWISGERIADFPRLSHPRQMYAVFCPIEKACLIQQAMTYFLRTLFLAHRFLKVLLR